LSSAYFSLIKGKNIEISFLMCLSSLPSKSKWFSKSYSEIKGIAAAFISKLASLNKALMILPFFKDYLALLIFLIFSLLTLTESTYCFLSIPIIYSKSSSMVANG
jgi:hypothetical protein